MAVPNAPPSRRPHPSSPAAVLLLAYLLVADGRPVSARGLAQRCWPGVSPYRQQRSLTYTVSSFRQTGLGLIADCWARRRGRTPIGYRLVELPPDDLLDAVLAAVHALRAIGATRELERWGRVPAAAG